MHIVKDENGNVIPHGGCEHTHDCDSAQAHHHEHAHDEHEEGETDGVHLEEAEYDEHVWTSPVNAKLLVENIRDMLISIDPDRVEIYEENATVYLEELDALWERAKET